LFSYVSIEERIPTSHPLRRIRKLADQALDRLNPTFCRLYALEGRPSVPSDHIWPPADFVYTKNRDRLLNDDVMGLFLEKLMGAPEVKPLLSDEHFSVDGTLLQAWASHASLKRIDGQGGSSPSAPWALARDSVLPKRARSGQKATFAASSSAQLSRPCADGEPS
jgi:hypothetical protein